MFLGEIVTRGADFIEDTTIDPGGIRARNKDSKALLADRGVILRPIRDGIVRLDGGTVPGRFLFGKSEGGVGLVVAEGERNTVWFRGNIGQAIVSRDVGGIGAVDASLHGSDTNRNVGHVDINKIGESGD